MKQNIPFINTGKTMMDCALQEIAWHKALIEAKDKGFTHVVSVTALPHKQIQLHYFKSLETATEFYQMALNNPTYWKRPFTPCTIKQSLKQCWS